MRNDKVDRLDHEALLKTFKNKKKFCTFLTDQWRAKNHPPASGSLVAEAFIRNLLR